MENKKSSIIIKRNIFRVLAVAIVVISVVCGILLAKTEAQYWTINKTLATKETFEAWRFVLFTFVGLIGGGCFFGISAVFDELEKMRNKKSK